ncbi:unnamed protein product [Moneuplotes crassus]|uniref:LITAF domain-containing protein n=1 Tax=Euplotes crassus TaxID=5936 RepID=A0AAD1XRV6_EUPCR|nr:unnamed protein product [Moneuplotes crassus]
METNQNCHYKPLVDEENRVFVGAPIMANYDRSYPGSPTPQYAGSPIMYQHPPTNQQVMQPPVYAYNAPPVNMMQPRRGGYLPRSYRTPPIIKRTIERRAPRARKSMFKGNIRSVYCECPSCGLDTHTKVESDFSSTQWCLCLILCSMQLYVCCLVPFCVNSWRQGNHFCGNCGSKIGSI